MIIQQQTYSPGTGWKTLSSTSITNSSSNLIFAFGSTTLMADPLLLSNLRQKYPDANILMNSTAGEIMDIAVQDETIAVTAVQFERTTLQATSITIQPEESSLNAGRRLGSQFETQNLQCLFIISDGQKVNGSDLVRGLQESLPDNTIITGGLAGDGVHFRKTLVGLNSAPVESCIAAIGFYGTSLQVTCGSAGGWDSFGPERLVTRSAGNILYELDGQPALEIYKKYLGEYASQLPSAGLLFPLSIRNGKSDAIVRTILGVNEEDNSLTFAGNIPEGYYARLMKASFDRLIEGAALAAQNSLTDLSTSPPDLAILISCVGRKIVLNQRIEEEVEIIRSVYGESTAITGFYSYGEISPSYTSEGPELHNQTMTITTFTEQLS